MMAQTQQTRTWLSVLFLSLALLGGALLLGRPAPVLASCGGTTNVASEADLNTAIAAFNAGGAGCVFTINQTAAFTLTADTTTINNNGAGSELIIHGNNTSIDADGHVAFTIDGTKVTADGLRIDNPYQGISANASQVIVTNSVITRPNDAAFYLTNSTATLTDVSVPGEGGGLAIYALGSNVDANRLQVTNTFNNTIILDSGSGLTLTDSTLDGSEGDGVEIFDSTALIKDSTISNGDSSGVEVIGGTATIINTTVTGNYYGAYVQDGTLLITNATISGNEYNVYAYNSAPGVTTLTVNNSILADSFSSDCSTDVFNGSIAATFKNSLFEDTDADACGLPAANPDANGNIVGEEAYLGPLGNYGGSTRTIPLLSISGNIVATSPAIDAGDNALAVDELSVALQFDQRGTGFPRIVNSTVDMGAYEGTYALTCATAMTVSDENEWNNAIFCYNLATLPLSYTITFDADIDLTAASLTIDNPTPGIDLIIDGPGFTLDGQDIPTVRPIRVAVDSDVTINDLTITGGNVDSGSPDQGGGIYNEGHLTLYRVTVTANHTDEDGGGIYNDEAGTLDIFNSSITNNTAGPDDEGDGGGIENEGFMTITDSVVSGNIAYTDSGAYGGGIYDEGHLVITRSTIANNAIIGTEDENVGGGIRAEGSLTIIDSTISGNTITSPTFSSASTGGGISYAPDSSILDDLGIEAELIIVNSTISGNSVTAELNAFGGGIYAEDEYLVDTVVKIINTTISNNSVAVTDGGGTAIGGGMYFVTFEDPMDASLTVTIDNTIIANSTTGGAAGGDCVLEDDVVFASNSSLYEDTGANACDVVNADANGNITGSDPVLGALGNNGGPTETHLPLAGSPAIDSGDNALALDPVNPLTADQRGFTPRIVNTIVDRGSVEVDAQGPVVGFCPVGDPAVGTTMTDLIGTGQGSKTKGYRTRKLVVPFSSDVVALYGQLASTDIGVMKYVRFLPQGYPKVQIHNPTSYAYRAYAISWWGSDLPADANYVKGQFFWGNKGNKSPRAFVLWPTYDTGADEYANVFTTFDTSMENHVAWETGFIPTQTQVMAIPEVQADGATVVVRVAVVDNDKDNRPVVLQVTVGTQMQSNADLVPNAKDTLNLYELTFTDVEAGVDEVTIYLESPVPSQLYADGGDSAAMIGAAVSYACAPAP